MQRQRFSSAGFSLIELVIVVVIIGIIGAIAIPRMSRGTDGAADSALIANLSVLRNAIDLYAVEHNGDYPELSKLPDLLTKRSNAQGAVDDGTGAAGGYVYGPYLRTVPPLPVGAQKGETGFIAAQDVTSADGWVYDENTGEVSANAAGSDVTGKAYADY